MKRVALPLLMILLVGCIGTPSSPPTRCSGPTVSIATFNIQIFGQAKMGDPEAVDSLVEIATQFDIVAIQEIRDASEATVPRFISEINSRNHSYAYVISERLGSTSSKEQYAFVYNTKTISFENASYLVNDTVFERPPFAAKFRAGGFDFFLVNTHVKPEKGRTASEITALAGAVTEDEDYIILGDFNADCSYLDEETLSSLLPGLEIIVSNEDDTTVGASDCTYDRIAITPRTREDYSSYGVYLFDKELGLDSTQAKSVSDHYPVYAEFYISCDSD